MFRRLKWFVPLACCAALMVFVYATAFGYLGCGTAKLEVEFQVVDAETGQPIEGAEITIVARGGHPQIDEMEYPESVTTVLQTDPTGSVVQYAGRCFATTSGDRFGYFTTTSVYPPNWKCGASAPGYVPVDPENIHRFAVPQERSPKGGMKQIVRWRLARE